MLVNKSGFLSSVLLLWLLQSFLHVFADIYHLPSLPPLLFGCSGSISSNSPCNRRNCRFNRPVMTKEVDLLSDSTRATLPSKKCIEKAGTKCKQGESETVKFEIAAHYFFNWKAKKLWERSLESLHAPYFFLNDSHSPPFFTWTTLPPI